MAVLRPSQDVSSRCSVSHTADPSPPSFAGHPSAVRRKHNKGMVVMTTRTQQYVAGASTPGGAR